jgi:hypothetical protein
MMWGTNTLSWQRIVTSTISPQSGWQWTWSYPKLHMGGFGDAGWRFWNLGGVTRWNSRFLMHTSTFLAIVFVASQLILLIVLDKSTAWNRCLQHPCFKNLCKIAQASQKFIFQRPTLPFAFANTFMIPLHALCTPRLPIPFFSHE